MKRIFTLLLALSMMFVLFGCGNYAEKLTGTWVCREAEDDEVITKLLDALSFEPEESALVSGTLYTAYTITFTGDGDYALAEDLELSIEYLREFLDDMFHDLYEGRASLANVYADDVSQMEQTEFLNYYASFYSCSTYEELLDYLSSELYTGEGFGVYDEGTFKATSGIISFDAIDDEYDGRAEYTLNGDRLTIKFEDGSMTFYKQN